MTVQNSAFDAASDAQTGPRLARARSVNWIGLWTLYKKEVARFLKIAMQTITAPMVSSLLFLFVFQLAFGASRPDVNGVPVVQFIAPGLIMMAILTNAFANTSSSILMSKIQGAVVDFLMPPLSPLELTIGFVAGGMTRGVVVAAATGIIMVPFVDMGVHHWGALLYYAVSASVLLSALGTMTGIWSEKFDHMAAITNFVIMPLVFLSGTFYSTTQLPPEVQTFTHYNPIFHLIDGFRFGIVGVADGDLMMGAIYVFCLNLLALAGCYLMFRSGYKLKD